MATKGLECIGIGILGLGVVGSGVAQSLMLKAGAISEQVGCPVNLKKVLIRTPRKKRSLKLNPSFITTDSSQILDDPNIAIVVEVMGGEEPAYTYIQHALQSGKHVVTANKEVMAKHGSDLLRMAGHCGVGIFYEASVGGGIPLIGPLKRDLVVNRVSSIYAIINGTTNYILSKMSSAGMEFDEALHLAQELGFAETNPANDIEGTDAAYKLAILAGLAFQAEINARDVYREGITGLTEHDFRYARELGYAIKLLAIGTDLGDTIEVRVHPVFIPESFLLAKVEGVYNAVQIEGDMIGKVLFYGEPFDPEDLLRIKSDIVINAHRGISIKAQERKEDRVKMAHGHDH
ncbi:MAG: homoserine dehydrogenase [Chloroflexota bacterium]|nr:homoserine dehydrogenase [Chloroflexota bacterium]